MPALASGWLQPAAKVFIRDTGSTLNHMTQLIRQIKLPKPHTVLVITLTSYEGGRFYLNLPSQLKWMTFLIQVVLPAYSSIYYFILLLCDISITNVIH